ncbi:hypothetical protein Tco_1344722 [Tanacetum coccineum]
MLHLRLGHVARECNEKKRAKDSQWFKDKALLMEAKEKGVILDAEAEAFLADVECTTPFAEPLAITTTTAFEVSHEDAYDSDVDEAPHVVVAFISNLMQTGPSTRQGTSNDTDFHSEVQTYDNHFFDNMNLQVSQEIHGGEQLDFDVDSVLDDHDNTIPYHQYQLNNEVESVPTDVSSIVPAELERYKIQVQNLEQSKVKKDLEQLVFERNKRNADLEEQLVSLKQQLLQHVESNKSLKTESEKLKANNNALEESYLEELVWLRNTNKVVTELLQSYGQPIQTIPMLSKRPNFSTKDLHKSALGHHNPMYLKSAQLCRPTLYLGDVIVDHVHTPFRVYDSEETLVQAKFSRTKMLERMKDPLCKVSSKPIIYAKLNSFYDTFVPQKQLSSEQVYWLPSNEVASYNCNQSKPITTFVRTRPTKSQVYTQLKMLKACFLEFDKLDKEYDQCVIDKKSLEIENKNLLIQNECLLAKSVSKDISSVMLTSDIAMPMSIEPRSNCVKEHSRNMDLEAEILKVCNSSSSPELNVFFEINKLKDQLQGKDELIRKLKAQIEELTAVRIKNDSLRDENVSIKKRYQDLYQSKAESNSNVSSRAAVPEKPKVLAPGLYAMTPKYVPPQKTNNRDANTPLPRKETVSLVKKTNVCVNLSIGIKSVTEASKSNSKCETKTHRNLPARSENVKRVDNPLRSLNKRNRVDSSLSVKRTGFISKSVSVCNICNECLVFGNHNKRGVKNLNSVNAKNPKVNNDVIVKQVWKATRKIFASVGSKWRPTGRKFTLGDMCPLTRITKPEVVPLEKSRSVSTSERVNNVIVTPRFSKKPLTSYKRKDRKLKDTSTGSPPNAETKAVNDPVNVNDLSANQ